MVSKYEISNVTPFQELFYRNCFFGPAFTALKYYGGNIYPFFSNDFFCYQDLDEEIGFNLIAKPLRMITESQIYSDMSIQINNFVDGDMFEWIKEQVSADKLVIVPINRYYWGDTELNREYYLKEHFLHVQLIYGYDDDTRKFNIMGLNNTKNYITTVDYEVLNQSFNKRVREQRRFSMFSMWSDKSIKQDANNVNLHKELYIKNFHSFEKQMEEGIEQIKSTALYYGNVQNAKHILLRHSQTFAYTINLVVNMRKAQTTQINTLFGVNDNLDSLTDLIVKEFTVLRGVFTKCITIQEYSEQSAKSVESRINTIYEYERNYFNEIKRIISK